LHEYYRQVNPTTGTAAPYTANLEKNWDLSIPSTAVLVGPSEVFDWKKANTHCTTLEISSISKNGSTNILLM
jgi:hypothetical protein